MVGLISVNDVLQVVSSDLRTIVVSLSIESESAVDVWLVIDSSNLPPLGEVEAVLAKPVLLATLQVNGMKRAHCFGGGEGERLK